MTNSDPKQTVDSKPPSEVLLILTDLYMKLVPLTKENPPGVVLPKVEAALLARERRLVLEGQKEVLRKINARSSGGGNWRRNIISEIAQLDALLNQGEEEA